MAAPVRTKIDLSQLDARPVLRLVPPLPDLEEERPRKERPGKPGGARVAEPKSRREVVAVASTLVTEPDAPVAEPSVRRQPVRHRYGHSRARAAVCSPAIRRRRRVAASILIGLGMFLAVLGVGALANAFTANTVPDRTTVVWVQPGETLWDIAERSAPGYNPEAVVARIQELNDIPGNNVVLAGQALQVPSAP